MDIEYLLLLQTFRNATNNVLSPIMDFITKFSVSGLLIGIAAMVFWAFDRKAGRRILGGLGLGCLVNGLIKLTFCINRPWVRDARIEPWGDSKVAATGYSFPSGHSNFATALFGGIGAWQWKKKRFVSIICFVLLALTMFSRNYLGVHTPQDVIIGFLSTTICMLVINLIENWTDKNMKRDIYVIVSSVVICIALLVYYYCKDYPIVLDENGELLVNPANMIHDSYEGIGLMLGYSISRFIERRKLSFDKLIPWKDRFIMGAVAILPLYLWSETATKIFEIIVNRSFGKFVKFAMIPVYIMIIVPVVMEKLYNRTKTKTAEEVCKD